MGCSDAGKSVCTRGQVFPIMHLPYSQVDRCRLEIGHFELETVGDIINGTMRLNLYDANVTGTLFTTAGSVRFTTLTFSSEHLFLIDIWPEDGEVNLQLRYVAEQGICNGRYQPEDYVKNPEPECWVEDTPTRAYHICQHRLLERGDYAEAYVIDSEGSRLRVVATIDNSIPANHLRPLPAKKGSVMLLEKALSRGVSVLLKEHYAFWHAYYRHSFLSIPDMKWEGFYWIQVLLHSTFNSSSTRSARQLAAPLLTTAGRMT